MATFFSFLAKLRKTQLIIAKIFTWDNDYVFYWKDGFISGIEYLKGVAGQNAEYGYKYTCDIFSDIGIKPPLMLLGTEEANRIAVEVGKDRSDSRGLRINQSMSCLYTSLPGRG